MMTVVKILADWLLLATLLGLYIGPAIGELSDHPGPSRRAANSVGPLFTTPMPAASQAFTRSVLLRQQMSTTLRPITSHAS
jgi:hypothetical protein